MYARWVALGTFQPLDRLHSDHGDRLPWEYGAAADASAAGFLRLREALNPYLYTARPARIRHRAPDHRLPVLELARSAANEVHPVRVRSATSRGRCRSLVGMPYRHSGSRPGAGRFTATRIAVVVVDRAVASRSDQMPCSWGPGAIDPDAAVRAVHEVRAGAAADSDRVRGGSRSVRPLRRPGDGVRLRARRVRVDADRPHRAPWRHDDLDGPVRGAFPGALSRRAGQLRLVRIADGCVASVNTGEPHRPPGPMSPSGSVEDHLHRGSRRRGSPRRRFGEAASRPCGRRRSRRPR